MSKSRAVHEEQQHEHTYRIRSRQAAPGQAHVASWHRDRLRSSGPGPRPGEAGQKHRPPRNRRARFRYSREHRRSRRRRAAHGLHALRPVGRTARPARSHRRRRHQVARREVHARRSGRRARRQAHHLLHHAGAGRGRRRGHLSQPRLPDLRVDDQLSWAPRPCRFRCARSAISASTSTN